MYNSDWKYIERFLGIIIGMLVAIIVYFTEFRIIDDTYEIPEKVLEISGIIFGFLFASLAILIQGGSERIDYLIRERKHLFKRIINYNELVVLLSLFVAIFSLLIIVFKWSDIILFDSIYAGIVSTMFFYTIIFLMIFYSAIKDNTN